MRYILLLDDDPNDLKNTKSVIEANIPISTIAAKSPEEAIHYITLYGADIDAFILDIEITGNKYSGIQVAEYIRNIEGRALVPIIFLTSHTHYGSGYLNRIHYYDFFSKPYNPHDLIKSITTALSLQPPDSKNALKDLSIVIHDNIAVKLHFENISCIEINGHHLIVTDLLGNIETYKVKPKTFANVNEYIENQSSFNFQQIHRCIIINTDRIRKIVWEKNTASVWLFNVERPKPIGKMFLSKMSIFKENPNVV